MKQDSKRNYLDFSPRRELYLPSFSPDILNRKSATSHDIMVD